jgi:hypothetical protein
MRDRIGRAAEVERTEPHHVEAREPARWRAHRELEGGDGVLEQTHLRAMPRSYGPRGAFGSSPRRRLEGVAKTCSNASSSVPASVRPTGSSTGRSSAAAKSRCRSGDPQSAT